MYAPRSLTGPVAALVLFGPESALADPGSLLPDPRTATIIDPVTPDVVGVELRILEALHVALPAGQWGTPPLLDVGEDCVRVVVSSHDTNRLDEHAWESLLEHVSAAATADGVMRRVDWTSVDGAPLRLRLWDRVAAALQPLPLTPAAAPGETAWTDDDHRLFFGEIRPAGPLADRRIALSPGHGLYWTGDRYTTQRADSFGLIEDYTTSIISAWHIDPYLRGAGADVVWMRERSRSSVGPEIIDAGAPGYSESGTFSDGSNPGGYGDAYRFADIGSGASARYQTTVEGEDVPVYLWFVPGANRSRTAPVVVEHQGGTMELTVDQTAGGPAWHYLGSFDIAAGDAVTIGTDTSDGAVVIADAVRFGTSTGGVVRDGQTTGQPGWREASVHYAEYSRAPDAVWQARASTRDSDVVVRPLWANLLGADLYVSIHTNGAGGTGTETYSHSTAPTAGSERFRTLLHTQVVDDIQAYWNPDWRDRGEKTADFGEIRELDAAPGALLEVAFHDRDPATGPDVDSLKDPRFRRIVGRAVARSIVRYFSADAPFVPEPPVAVVLRNTEAGLVAEWAPSDGREASGLADAYRVYVAQDGRAWDAGQVVAGATSLTLGTYPVGTVVSVRVAGVNAGGEGTPSTAVAAVSAGPQAAPVMMAAAFERWDRFTQEEGNTFDYLIPTALAMADVRTSEGARYAADGMTAAAMLTLAIDLDDYELVLWQAGEESTADETFTAAQIDELIRFAGVGGRLLVSGSEVGWDLWERGGADERAFFADVLNATFLADDAGTRSVEGIADTPFADVAAFLFDDGSAGIYDVDYPDVMGAGPDAFVGLRYTGSGGAAVLSERAVLFGFPLEAVVEPEVRTRLLRGALGWLRVSALSDEGTVADPEPDAGTRPDAGFEFDASELDTSTGQAGDGGSEAGASDVATADVAPDTTASADIGSRVDAEAADDGAQATRQVQVRGGGGCSAASGETPPTSAPAALLLMAGGWLVRRRR